MKDEPDPKGAAADETAHAAVATPGALFRRPIALVLQAGSVAAAITSILGLVVIFAPGLVRGLSLGGGDGSAEREVTVEVSKGQEIKLAIADKAAVERMTFGKWLRDETGTDAGVSAAERRRPGVNVHYRAKFPGFALGSPFRARFSLKDEAGVTSGVHVTKGRLDADSDECRCAEFVPVPVAPKSYRVLVELYRPGAPFAAPVIGAYTDFFSAAGPVSD